MSSHNKPRWVAIERWSPHLFLLAGLFLIIGASTSGLAFFIENRVFDNWVGLTLEFGRLAALTGTVGLSVQVSRKNTRLGQLSRGIAVLAIIFTIGLIVSATLTAAGFLSGAPPVVGLSTYVLSVSTFLMYGVVIIRTGSHPTSIGVLLLVNVAALLVVFFGRLALPLGLIATVVPGFQVLLYSGIGYHLRLQTVPTQGTTPMSERIL